MLEAQSEQQSTIKKEELLDIYDALGLMLDNMEGVKDIADTYLHTGILPSTKTMGALLTVALDASNQLNDVCDLLGSAIKSNAANE